MVFKQLVKDFPYYVGICKKEVVFEGKNIAVSVYPE